MSAIIPGASPTCFFLKATIFFPLCCLGRRSLWFSPSCHAGASQNMPHVTEMYRSLAVQQHLSLPSDSAGPHFGGRKGQCLHGTLRFFSRYSRESSSCLWRHCSPWPVAPPSTCKASSSAPVLVASCSSWLCICVLEGGPCSVVGPACLRAG